MARFGFSTTAEEIVEAFPDRIKGRTFVITGTGANGLGAQAAISLAAESPAHLILLSRTKSKVDPVIKEIATTNSAVKTTFISITLDDFDSVRQAAAEVNKLTDHIDVLINNAGVMAIPELTRNKDGIETTLATNHVGHFLLTKLLMPKILVAANKSLARETSDSSQDKTTATAFTPRIINLTSRGHQISSFISQDPSFTDPQNNPYNPWISYGQSKTCNILFTLMLSQSATFKAEEAKPKAEPKIQSSNNNKNKILTFAVHPGGIYTTGLTTHLTEEDFSQIAEIAHRTTGGEFKAGAKKTLTQGASSILWAALDPSLDDIETTSNTNTNQNREVEQQQKEEEEEEEEEEIDDDPNQTSHPSLYINDCQFETCREYARDIQLARQLWTWTEGVIGERFDLD